MYISIKTGRLAAIAAFCMALAACGTTQPNSYSGISSSSKLMPNQNNDTGRVPYSYSTSANWKKYNAIIIDPVVVYRGPDQQFGDMSEKDKTALASYMQTQFAEKLTTRFTLSRDQAPNTLRLKLTLTGAETNTPVLATLSRFDIAGGIYNGVQNARNREGTLTGSVIYAVEVYDAASDRLLSAFITKQYPRPWNLGASMGSLAASKAGIEKGADALVEQLK
ncbi:Protein of unknown function [Collimonas sp. OK307]|uniref:DUF3313 domain-containing protein n=1 Tax=Collimonas sp. OK307 TaxID=1801620 RepID=UPI0008F29E54|nr:Protein of unknown function [Collimonas sp. OK307]